MPTITFSTTFNLRTTTKQFQFVDTTDWAGQGISTTNLFGKFKITSPSGVIIYNNTTNASGGCDINIQASTSSQLTIALPLASGGYPEAGIYTIDYTVYSTALVADYTAQQNTYTYSYVSPAVEIEQTVDCISPLFTSSDITNYEVDGLTPTKVEVHTVYYPVGTAGYASPTVGSGITVTTGTFWNGTQSTEIESTLTYVYSDDLIIWDIVTGTSEVLVDCVDACAIYCCVRSAEQRMITAQTANRTEYPALALLFSQAMGVVGLILLARTCTKSTDISGYLTYLRNLLNCTDDCSCSGDAPTQVTGLGGLVNEVVVNSAGEPISVNAVTVGNTTTYTITFNPDTLSLINSLYNTEVVAGTHIYSVTSSVVGLVKTFTINGEAVVVVAGKNITSVTSATVAGVTTYTINSDMAIVSAGYGVAVSGPVVAAGDYVYTVASSLVGTTAKAISSFAVTVSNNLTVTGCTVTAPTTGTYLIMAEADCANTIGADFDLTYRLLKNGATAITDDRIIISTGVVGAGDTNTFKMVTPPLVASLTAADTIVLQTDSGTGGSIYGRSITIIRIA